MRRCLRDTCDIKRSVTPAAAGLTCGGGGRIRPKTQPKARGCVFGVRMVGYFEKNGQQKEERPHNREVRHMGAGEGFSGTADTDESRFLASLNAFRHQGMQKRRTEKTNLRKVKKEAREKTKKEGHENKLGEAITEIFLCETTKKFDISTAQIAALADDELSLLDAWLIQKSRRRRMASALICAVTPIFGWFIGFMHLLGRSDRSSRAMGHYVFYRKKLDRSCKVPSFPFEKIHYLTGNQKTPNAQKQNVAEAASNGTQTALSEPQSVPRALINAGPHDLLAQKLYRLRAENKHKSEETRKQSAQDFFVFCFLRAAAHYYFLDGARIAAMTDAELEMLDALIIRRTRRIRALVRTATTAGFLGVPIIGWLMGAAYLSTRRDYLLQGYSGQKLPLCRYRFFRKTFRNIHGADSFPHERIRQCAANGFN